MPRYRTAQPWSMSLAEFHPPNDLTREALSRVRLSRGVLKERFPGTDQSSRVCIPRQEVTNVPTGWQHVRNLATLGGSLEHHSVCYESIETYSSATPPPRRSRKPDESPAPSPD